MIIFWIAAGLCLAVLVATWIGAIMDMRRRADISGVQMALWIVALILFPILGVIAYMVFRPSPDKIRYRGETVE